MTTFVEIISGTHADGATGCRSDYGIQSLLNRGFSKVPLPMPAHAKIDDPRTISRRLRNEINGFQQSHGIAQLPWSALIPRGVMYEHKVRFGCYSNRPMLPASTCGNAGNVCAMGTASGVRIRRMIA